MKKLLFLFIILSTAQIKAEPPKPPKPTPEIQKYIKQLDDDSWQVRNKAQSNLEKAGWNAIGGLIEAINNTDNDFEVREAARSLFVYYYNPTSNSTILVPSIWYMPNKIRFPHGYTLKARTDCSLCLTIKEEDIALKYMKKVAEARGITWNDSSFQWQDETLIYDATRLWAAESLINGECRDTIVKIMDQMSDNTDTCNNYRQSDNITEKSYDWWTKPPGPLLNEKDFTSPNWVLYGE